MNGVCNNERMNISLSQFPQVRATYDIQSGKITLPSGTPLEIDLADKNSHPQSNFNQARELAAAEKIWVADGKLVCKVDLVDLSPSAAWVLVSGTAGSGPKNWKISEPEHPLNGQSISALEEASGSRGKKKPDERDSKERPTEERPIDPSFLPIVLHEVLSVSAGRAHDPFAALRDYFAQANRYKRVVVNTVAAFKHVSLLDGPGVYIVSELKDDHTERLLYIGKAGKWVRDDNQRLMLNDGVLSLRTDRWTPYAYQKEGKWAEHFEYGPNFTGKKPLPNPDNYRHQVPLSKIVTHCFLLAGVEKETSPALLESLLLQHFLLTHGDLPPANQEF